MIGGREGEGSAVWLRPHFDEVSGGLSHRLGGRGAKGWALVGQDGGLKAISFVILPHAVSSKPRYLEEAISFVILPHAVSSKPRYLEEAFSFVILPHAVSSKPRYLEEEGGRKVGLWGTG